MDETKEETVQEKKEAVQEVKQDAEEIKQEAEEINQEAKEAVQDGKKGEQKELELDRLVEDPTWREMLLDLVSKDQLDPWNIDIVEITRRYIARIKKMKVLDLHIPSNVILAAAILLRFKSETLALENEENVIENEVFIEEPVPVEIPMLELKVRVPPKRSVTLGDLIHALEEVIDIEKKRNERKKRYIPEFMEIKIPRYDIEEEIKEIYQRTKKLADNTGWLSFSALVKDKYPDEDSKNKNGQKEDNSGEKETDDDDPVRIQRNIMLTLLPLLYLSQEEKISIIQEKIFGEIFIKVLKESKKEAKKKND